MFRKNYSTKCFLLLNFWSKIPENQIMERVKGIEPSYTAWKAVALPLSYTRNYIRGTEIWTQNKSSQRTCDSRFTIPRYTLIYITFPFSRQNIFLPFINIFVIKYVCPRSSIGQSDRLLICRLCVRFAPGTHLYSMVSTRACIVPHIDIIDNLT